jgi:hypothetical protein
MRFIHKGLDGQGRNEIARSLNLSHIMISEGAVSGILKAWKCEHGNSDIPPQPVACREAVTFSKVTLREARASPTIT